MAELDLPWTRSLPARAVRAMLIRGVFGPLIAAYARREVVGRERLAALDGPVIFVANHCSHVDTPVLLGALPARRRRRTGVAAAADYFYTGRALATGVSLTFGTVPVQRYADSGAGGSAQLGRLLDDGWSLLLFAEGTRSRDGRLGRLHSGAVALGAPRGLPIVPVHLSGTGETMPPGHRWMVRARGGEDGAVWSRHTIRIRFGAPIRVGAHDDRVDVMESVRVFMRSCSEEPWRAAVADRGTAAAQR